MTRGKILTTHIILANKNFIFESELFQWAKEVTETAKHYRLLSILLYTLQDFDGKTLLLTIPHI